LAQPTEKGTRERRKLAKSRQKKEPWLMTLTKEGEREKGRTRISSSLQKRQGRTLKGLRANESDLRTINPRLREKQPGKVTAERREKKIC